MSVTTPHPWLQHTLIHIPELQGRVEDVDTPMLLWIEINGLFSQAVKHGEEDLIRRIFEEADYYFHYENNTKGDPYGTAVALTFVEHWLDDPRKAPFVIKYVPKADFIANKSLLTYHHSEDDYQTFLAQYPS